MPLRLSLVIITAGLTGCSNLVHRIDPFDLELLPAKAESTPSDAADPLRVGGDGATAFYIQGEQEPIEAGADESNETTISIGGSMSSRTQEINGSSSTANTVSGHLGLGRFVSDHLEFRFDYNGTRNWSSQSGSRSTGVSNVNLQLKFWEDRLAKTSLYGGPQLGIRFSPGVDSSTQSNVSFGGVIGINAFLGDDQRDVSGFIETNFVFADEEFSDGTGGSSQVSITDVTFTVGFSVWL